VIIATNTSSISITKLAAATSAPTVHRHALLQPVPMMALVEIIRGLQTSDATHDAVKALAGAGQVAHHRQERPGFVVNRILVPMINEAFFVLAEGLATPEDIDAGMKLGCNQPIGPLALADMVGLDVCLAVMEVYLEVRRQQVPRLPAAARNGGRRPPGPQDRPGRTTTERRSFQAGRFRPAFFLAFHGQNALQRSPIKRCQLLFQERLAIPCVSEGLPAIELHTI
jgi:hypothetical protein